MVTDPCLVPRALCWVRCRVPGAWCSAPRRQSQAGAEPADRLGRAFGEGDQIICHGYVDGLASAQCHQVARHFHHFRSGHHEIPGEVPMAPASEAFGNQSRRRLSGVLQLTAEFDICLERLRCTKCYDFVTELRRQLPCSQIIESLRSHAFRREHVSCRTGHHTRHRRQAPHQAPGTRHQAPHKSQSTRHQAPTECAEI